jgi:hypothetical protein
LVELLLYVVVSATILIAATGFLAVILSARVKNQTVNEVEQQGLAVMEAIGTSVRNASAVISPAAGAAAAGLTLDVVAAANDPTTYALSSGVLQITEGVAVPVALTNARVTISDLTFHNLGRSGTPGSVRYSFTLTHVNPANRQEFTYSKTFTGSASLRHPL